jgi:hypothetical protein
MHFSKHMVRTWCTDNHHKSSAIMLHYRFPRKAASKLMNVQTEVPLFFSYSHELCSSCLGSSPWHKDPPHLAQTPQCGDACFQNVTNHPNTNAKLLHSLGKAACTLGLPCLHYITTVSHHFYPSPEIPLQFRWRQYRCPLKIQPWQSRSLHQKEARAPTAC